MKFVDQVRIQAKAGDGGNGCIAFRREKFIPFGGPAGGDGANGGSVVFLADEGRTSLLDLANSRTLRAHRGEHGRGKDQYGRRGEDLVVKVPIGTQVSDANSGELIADLSENGQTAVVAKGGKGGRGNIHFATPYDRAPRRADPGEPGEERKLLLELKVMADVGLLGFPNVGKSTLVRSMSRARPKVADYQFTTLQPHLGVVKIGGGSSSATFVMADIPGLIPGASEGKGIGTRFLKHVERCRALLHLVAPPTDDLREEGREPLADFDALMHELRTFAPDLAERPMIVAMSKADLFTDDVFAPVAKAFAKRGIQLRRVSAATNAGVTELGNELYHLVRGRRAAEDDAEAEPTSPEVLAQDVKDRARAARLAKKKKAEQDAAPATKRVATKPVPKKKPTKKSPATKKKAALSRSGAKKSATKKPVKKSASKRMTKRPSLATR
ncbi:MAG: GTPase ObgE, partial [Polyangiales bacterium]